MQQRRLTVVTVARDAGSAYGGAERVAYEFARRLDPSRFRSVLCTTQRPPADRQAAIARDRAELVGEGVGVLALDQSSALDRLSWLRLFALLRREHVDIVHAHMPRASVPAAILARLARVPVVISHEHGSVFDGKVLRPLLDRLVVGPMSTQVLAVSEWDRRQLIEHSRVAAERIAVLPNGISAPPPARPAGPGLRAELGVPETAQLIGAVGRLFPEKGYADLIDAMAVLRARGLDAVCAIAGDGPQRAELEARIAAHGLERQVRLIGRRSDVPALLAAFDIAVLPSVREGAPLAIIEYMAAGRPIVATAVGGIPELIEDGRHGLLVPRSDPPALADALDRLLADPELGRELGAAARVRQREAYDLDRIVARLEDLYLALYGSARSPGAGAGPPKPRL